MEHLPRELSNYDLFFQEVTTFLEEYYWVYSYKGTHLLLTDTLEKIPSSWVSTFEQFTLDDLNGIVNGITKLEWPSSLQCFVNKCCQLYLHLREYSLESEMELNIPHNIKKHMSLKKQHEVNRLAHLILQQCQTHKCGHVIDIGAGLGYLDNVLHLCGNIQVLGLDSQTAHVEAAKRLLSTKNFTPACDGIQQKHLVLEDPDEALKAIIPMLSTLLELGTCHCNSTHNKTKPTRTVDILDEQLPPVCLVGLHCCGDLSSTILELFSQYPQFSLLVLVPCCYHKRVTDAGHAHLEHFPMSLKLHACVTPGNKWLNTHLLRLAAQEAPSKWRTSEKQHLYHSQRVAYRSLLQVYAEQGGLVLGKKRRGIHKTHLGCPKSYVEAASKCYGINERHKEPLLQLFLHHMPSLRVVEGLSALQALIQPLCEHLILADALVYLQEQKCEVKLVKIFNDSISPRSLALVATK